MDLAIAGKNALVLASSRGLGKGIAAALAKEGANVIMCGRTADLLQANCDAINSQGGGRADWIQGDLCDLHFADSVATEALHKLGRVDILVNNSGGPPPGSTEDMTEVKLLSHFQSMVLNLIGIANRLLPGMKDIGWGRILTVASSGVIEPIPGLALSNTLRPALAGWSKTLASEIARFGVTSNMLLPGSIQTDRLNSLNMIAAERSGRTVEQVSADAQTAIPIGRYGTVEEFAATAAFLCSAPASYITGAVIRCDGGSSRSV
ncbi:SDR family oxidoreductase [Sinorhizobium meliloti]|uniref:SDR family oxidoreductase n=1 Tax=Rhizobium meliloti TaxID=382 RepID=UPI00398CA768